MRVLCVNDLPLGQGSGAEIYLERLVGGLRAAGDEVEVFAPPPRPGPFGGLLDVWDPLARAALARRAKWFRPQLVHHHNVLREVSVSVLGAAPGVPVALTVHDWRLLDGVESPPGPVRGLLTRRVVSPFQAAVVRRSATAVMAVSEPLARALDARGFPGVRAVPVLAPPPAVPTRTVSSCTDVLYAGQLVSGKGVEVLLEAFRQVHAAFPDTRLIMAGDGPARPQLGARVHTLRLPVDLPGRVSPAEVSGLMGRARVVVVPSIQREGTPLAAVEAAMHARPVLGSDDPGLRAVIDGLGCGLVVPAGRPAPLAAALEHLLGDPGLAHRLGAAGARSAPARYGITPATARVRDIYAEFSRGG